MDAFEGHACDACGWDITRHRVAIAGERTRYFCTRCWCEGGVARALFEALEALMEAGRAAGG